MKKILSSILAVMFVFSGITNVNALTPNQVQPRATIYEETKTKYLNVYNSSGSSVGTFKTSCTATIRGVNGNYSIDSYKLSSPTQYIGSTKVTATDIKRSIKGLEISVTWKLKAEFGSIPPKIVYIETPVVYSFN